MLKINPIQLIFTTVIDRFRKVVRSKDKTNHLKNNVNKKKALSDNHLGLLIALLRMGRS